MGIVHADDLNGFRELEHSASVDSVMTEAKRCQTELHKWGKAKEVSFHPAKESVHIVSHAQPHGDSFFLLGFTFDCKLRMDLCVRETASQASWKVTTILRTRSFHEVTRLVQVFKSKILSFVEYRTPAVYHAASTFLAGIDAIQKRFFGECSPTEEDALLFFNLAPAGNTSRYCNAGPDSPICSWIWSETLCEHVPTRAPIDLSETLLAPPVHTVVPSSTEAGPFDTGSHRCPQSASSKGGRAEGRRSNATRIAMPPEIQSSEQGRRLAAHLFTLRLSEHPLHHLS